MARTSNRRVVAVLYDGLTLFEFGLTAEIFGLTRPEVGRDWYQFSTCSVDRSTIRTNVGIALRAETGLRALRRAGTIILPGWRDPEEPPPAGLVQALRQAHARGARILSICSGVFVLAATGLLDGKRATTHWRYVERLCRRFPQVRVETNVLYVDEGQVLSSAGSAAGIDLCLHLVRRDFGAEVGNQVARRLVMAPHRDGGQAQYVRETLPRRAPTPIAGVLDWALTQLKRPLGVAELARQAHMSPRTLARRFVEGTGTTPHRWLTHQRLLAAQRRLEATRDSVETVANAVGFENAMTLRHHFRRSFGTTPTAYRRRFAVMQPAGN
jgi:AraC family transcriptional regulator, transcriptional activator FtrA